MLMSGTKDKNGVYLIKDLRDAAQKGGGFVTYNWPKPGAGDVDKISYAEMIPGTKMWIGTGVYLDNIATYQGQMTTEISGQVKKSIIAMLITAGLIFSGILCSHMNPLLKSLFISKTSTYSGGLNKNPF